MSECSAHPTSDPAADQKKINARMAHIQHTICVRFRPTVCSEPLRQRNRACATADY
ncbi:MAG: hypothetical protein GXY61_11180 [Lentisphaerae bacterium]|nr:hypothetical protein [Lentisphaerota bacterium]